MAGLVSDGATVAVNVPVATGIAVLLLAHDACDAAVARTGARGAARVAALTRAAMTLFASSAARHSSASPFCDMWFFLSAQRAPQDQARSF
jgi:hypothetical protein